MKLFTFFISLIFVGSLAGPTSTPTAPGPACGEDYWAIKTGTDPDASSVNLSATTPTTIADMVTLAPPSASSTRKRVAPTETTMFVISATLVGYQAQGDLDYHLLIGDDHDNTMITEIPSPTCVAPTSPFFQAIAHARATFDAKLQATTRFQLANIPVKITGVGFFDTVHGQFGVAPNGIELHPVLDVVFGSGPTTQTPITLQAPAVQNITSWVYSAIAAVNPDALVTRLNSAQANGWELVNVVYDPNQSNHYVAFLRRPKGDGE